MVTALFFAGMASGAGALTFLSLDRLPYPLAREPRWKIWASAVTAAALSLGTGLVFGTSAPWLHFSLLSALLVSSTVIDLYHRIIPNVLISLGLLAALFLGFVWPLRPWSDSLIGLVTGGGLLLITALIQRGGMGIGDVKLAGVMGMYLGWPGILVSLFVAFVTGAVAGIILIILGRKRGKDLIPFGPFLALGGLVAAFWGEGIVRWYLGG